MMNIGYVCTNYNNSRFTREAVRSIVASCPASRVVVVDNKSDADDVAELKRIELDFDNVELILGDENLGYFPGLNKGIRYLRQAWPDVQFMVVGNNDLIFPPDFLAAMERNLACLCDHAVVSPDIVTVDGVHQNPHVIEAISWPRELAYDIYYSSHVLALLIAVLARMSHRITDRNDEARWEVGGPIYQGHGSCYILGPKFFEYFEELWAPTFLMGEEFFLSKQLMDKGMRVYYEPGIRVVHQYHAAVSQIPAKKMWEIARDAHKVYRRHVGIFGPKSGAPKDLKMSR